MLTQSLFQDPRTQNFQPKQHQHCVQDRWEPHLQGHCPKGRPVCQCSPQQVAKEWLFGKGRESMNYGPGAHGLDCKAPSDAGWEKREQAMGFSFPSGPNFTWGSALCCSTSPYFFCCSVALATPPQCKGLIRMFMPIQNWGHPALRPSHYQLWHEIGLCLLTSFYTSRTPPKGSQKLGQILVFEDWVSQYLKIFSLKVFCVS